MTLMIARDPVELYPAGAADEHGWRQPAAEPYWCGAGNLQLTAGLTLGRSDPRASAGGGHGPYDPARDETGLLYLPIDARPVDGTAARVRDAMYVLSQTRYITDPAGTGLDCWMAAVTGTGAWPGE